MAAANKPVDKQIEYYKIHLKHAIDIILENTKPFVGSKYSWREARLGFDIVLIEKFETAHNLYNTDPRHFIIVKYADAVVLEAIMIKETDYLEVITLVDRSGFWSGEVRNRAGHIIMDKDKENSAREQEEEQKEHLKIYKEDLENDIKRALAGAKPFSGHLVSGKIIEGGNIKVYQCQNIKEDYPKIYIEFCKRTVLIAILKEKEIEFEKWVNLNLWKKDLKALAKETEDNQRKELAKKLAASFGV